MPSRPPARPLALTLLCVFLWIGSAASVLMLRRWPGLAGYPRWFFGYTVVYSIASGTALFGIWKMRTWGLWSYVAVSVLSQLVLMSIHHWTVGSLLLVCIVLGVIARFRHSFS